jgi:hypothetical protein
MKFRDHAMAANTAATIPMSIEVVMYLSIRLVNSEALKPTVLSAGNGSRLANSWRSYLKFGRRIAVVRINAECSVNYTYRL